jgi:hypothetical protein
MDKGSATLKDPAAIFILPVKGAYRISQMRSEFVFALCKEQAG